MIGSALWWVEFNVVYGSLYLEWRIVFRNFQPTPKLRQYITLQIGR